MSEEGRLVTDDSTDELRKGKIPSWDYETTWRHDEMRKLCKAQRDLTMSEVAIIAELNDEDRHFLQVALIALCSEGEDSAPTLETFAKAKRVSAKLGLQTDLLDAMEKAHRARAGEHTGEEEDDSLLV